MAAKKKNPAKVINNPRNAEERKKALEAAMAKIEKDMGKGSLMFLGDSNVNMSIEAIPTGAMALDVALGIGGLPRGRIVEIFGKESSGKTTVALHVVAEAQKMGGTAAFIDAEHALDPEYAKRIGVDTDHLLISQPDNGESALEIAETLARSGAVDVIVVDSVAALVPRAEIEGDMGESSIGVQARLMSQALRKLASVISKSNTLIIFINQLRQNIGMAGYGGGETTTGGRALKFYASVRLDVRAVDVAKESNGNICGSIVSVKVAKNKVAPPFRYAKFTIHYGKGIVAEASVLDMAVDANIITKSGSWYSYGEQRMGQGSNTAIKWLQDHPEELKEIEEKVRESCRTKNGSTVEANGKTGKATKTSAADTDEILDDLVDEGEALDDILDLDL